MSASPPGAMVDRAFRVGLVLKGLDGILELVGGLLLLVVTPSQIHGLVQALTMHELSEDPQDLVAGALVRTSEQLSVSATTFAAIYLLVHGLVKVLLVGAVLRDRLWAYPVLIGFLVLFICYPAYQLTLHFSWPVVALIAFDSIMLVLTSIEYRSHLARRTTT